MCTNDLTQLESIAARDARALIQYLTVLDDVGRARFAPGKAPLPVEVVRQVGESIDDTIGA
jgi:hypothetical protein